MAKTFVAVVPDGPTFDTFAFLRPPWVGERGWVGGEEGRGWGVVGRGSWEGVGSGWPKLLVQLLPDGPTFDALAFLRPPWVGERDEVGGEEGRGWGVVGRGSWEGVGSGWPKLLVQLLPDGPTFDAFAFLRPP